MKTIVVLVTVLVALIKHPDKSNLREKGLFWLIVQDMVYSGGEVKVAGA